MARNEAALIGIEVGLRIPGGSSVVRRLPLQAPERTPVPQLSRAPLREVGAELWRHPEGGGPGFDAPDRDGAEPSAASRPGSLQRVAGGLLAAARWAAVCGLLLIASAGAFWASYRYLAPALGITAAHAAAPAHQPVRQQLDREVRGLAANGRAEAGGVSAVGSLTPVSSLTN